MRMALNLTLTLALALTLTLTLPLPLTRHDRLVTHTDDSELSFNLLLSEPADFDGGGTSFEAAGSQ